MRLPRTIVLILATTFAAAYAAGQPRTQAEPQREQAVMWTDYSFSGGTLSEYIATLNQAYGATNAAVTPGLEAMPIGPIEMRSAGLADAMNAIAVLSSGKLIAVSNGPLLWQIVLSESPAKSTQFRAWALAWLTEQRESKDILSAVQTAVDMVDPGAEIKFHTDTKLLLVKGTPDQISAVDQVIASMLTNIRQIAVDQSAAAVTSEERWKSERQELMARIAALEAQLRALPPSRRQP